MLSISESDIRARIERDNPWWENADFETAEQTLPRRTYFDAFCELALNTQIRRATVLLGPRRVGKTVMLKQLVKEARNRGWNASNILYVSIDTPVYSGTSLDKFLSFMSRVNGDSLVIFDEIQYLKGWELHLKDLVDTYPDCKFVASGSAAAALRLKSAESGAGRFSEFMLPPLTFHEFLKFVGDDDKLIEQDDTGYVAKDIRALNERFIDYLNFGGFPEAVFNQYVRQNPDQFVRSDIIDKILLKDLPNLYGINEIQELNKLFSFLAYNAGNEASLEKIAKESGLAKPTIKRYIEYLESAFLIIKVSSVDQNCKSMKRERAFKIYINNPSMRSALFTPVSRDDETTIGHLAECAVFSQWQHSGFSNVRYARWKNEGEVDIVYLSSVRQKPHWAVEIKWSDRVSKNRGLLSKMSAFCSSNGLSKAKWTTKTYSGHAIYGGVHFEFSPTSLYCYTVGRNITTGFNLNSGISEVRETSDQSDIPDDDQE